VSESQWVPLQDALKLLGGMKAGTFTYYVRIGRVRLQEGRVERDRRYNVDDILKLYQERRPRNYHRGPKPEKKKEPLLLDWSRIADVPVMLALDQAIYPEEIDFASLATYQAWRKQETRLSMAAFSKDRKECYGYVQMIPLDESIILDILRGKRTESSIQPDEIRPYNQPGAYTLFAVSAVARPDHPDVLYKMVSKIMDFWVEQYPERYVSRIYAQAVSASGDKLISHLFMSPRYDLAHNAYMLDLARPGASKAVRLFQQRLMAKAPLPAELQPDYTLPTVPPADA
jgi:hypothetical protein